MAEPTKFPVRTILGFPMEDALHGIQYLCTVGTIGFFATGILTSLKIVRENSVQDVNFLPYLLTCLKVPEAKLYSRYTAGGTVLNSCALWSSYGYFANDWVVIGVNVSGMLMQMAYIGIYLRFLNDTVVRQHCYRRMLAAVGFYMTVCTVVYLSPKSVSQQLFGLTCDIVTILMFLSPLSTLGQVLRDKNTKSMSFAQSLMMLVVSSSWLFYGYLLSDMYIKVPNGLGALLAAVQLSLFAKYPSVDKGGGKRSSNAL